MAKKNLSDKLAAKDVDGRGLSKNDFTDSLKNQLASVPDTYRPVDTPVVLFKNSDTLTQTWKDRAKGILDIRIQTAVLTDVWYVAAIRKASTSQNSCFILGRLNSNGNVTITKAEVEAYITANNTQIFERTVTLADGSVVYVKIDFSKVTVDWNNTVYDNPTEMYLRVDETRISTLYANIDNTTTNVLSSRSNNKIAVLWKNSFRAKDWINTGWTLSGGNTIFSTTTSGVANSLVLDRQMNVEKKTMRCLFSMSSNCVAVWRCKGKETANANVTYMEVIVNAANQTFYIGNSGGNNTAVAGTSVAFTFNALHVYQIETRRDKNILTVRLKNMTTAEVWTTSATGSLYTTTYIRDSDVYTMYMYAGSSLTVSGFSVTCKRESWYFCGDSITEGVGITPNGTGLQRWADLAIQYLGVGGLISGRLGGTMSGITEKLITELPFLLPDYAVLTIGTNGGNSETNLTNWINGCRALGITPILNHVPVKSTDNQSAINAVIDTVVGKTGVQCCKFDIATSLNYTLSSGYDSSLFAGDGLHSNEAGSARMFNRIKVDITDI